MRGPWEKLDVSSITLPERDMPGIVVCIIVASDDSPFGVAILLCHHLSDKGHGSLIWGPYGCFENHFLIPIQQISEVGAQMGD